MEINDRIHWLRQNTPFSTFSDQVLAAIAAACQDKTLQENRRLILEDTVPTAVYILRSGRLEAYHTSADSLANASSLLPGSVLHLKELLLDEPAEQTIITLSECQLWEIPRDLFMGLVENYPEISRTLSRQLAAELDQMAAQLAFEQERQTALRPYLVPKVKQGIVGASRYAVRLRQDIRKAAGDRRPVLIFGEPGLGKDNIAALVHFGSESRKQPLIKINCESLQPNGAELFGRAGGKAGLLEWLGTGTLMLNNVQDLPKDLQGKIQQVLTTGDYVPVSREGAVAETKRSQARIIMTAERNLPEGLNCKKLGTHIIKVPPLRVTKADIAAQVTYYISLFCRAKGLTQPKVAPEALRRLQGYDFPGNLSELEGLVERAVIQSNGASVLTEEVFWSTSTKGRRFRLNLLNANPRLRQFLRSPWWPDRINDGFTLWFFAIVVALLFLGPQSRDANIALNLFWAWWWLLILVAFPFVGRLWCSVCPFMIYGELTQKLSLKLFPRQLLPWPRQQAEQWGGWFLFGLFALILLWEELWDLENTAYLSACLLLLITAGAMIFSALFERRFWCRYLCPIGGMNGMFAKLSMIELRAQQGICAASCTTYQCYKGGPQKGEGLETGGCPVYSHPAQLEDNRDCVLCMTCLKACPHRSVELNLRPPGIELWTTHTPTPYEVALLFLMFGAVFLHRLPEITDRLGLSVDLTEFGTHAALSTAVLLVPGAIALLSHQLIRAFNFKNSKAFNFVVLAYGYLPLVLGANVAHYLRLGLTEMGRIVPVTLATFGMSGGQTMAIAADPAVIAFLQGTALLATAVLSLFLTQRIARQSLKSLLPQHAATLGLVVLLWQVIV
jgi:transcriptional regulator with AAA-type ATPase domain/NAD-dependent dihydropyrimidine dehydrogenase PreA subunit